jgi:predicted transposase YdaD
MSYDSILKFIIDEYSLPLVSWLLQNPVLEEVEILKTELNVEPIRADGVFFLKVEGKILHLELQTSPQSKPPLPLRMLDYWVRLYRLYEREIEQIIIFLQPSNSSTVFQDSFQVGETKHRYRIIRIWECEPEGLLEIPELLPLAILSKSEQPEKLLSQVAEKIDKIEDKAKKSNIAACVELLAGLKLSEEIIAKYLQEEIMQESVIYQKILGKGLQQGELSMLSRLIRKRFGEMGENLLLQLNQLSLEQLETLGENLFDFHSIDEVITWVNQALANSQ